MDRFWSWESCKDKSIYKVFESAFDLIISDQSLKNHFFDNISKWVTSQTAERTFEYIFSLSYMCRQLGLLKRGHLEDEFDEVLAKALAKLKPSEAETYVSRGNINDMMNNFNASGYYRAKIAIISLLTRENKYLAKKLIEENDSYSLLYLWQFVMHLYDDIPNSEESSDDDIALLNFRNFLIEHKLINGGQ